MKLELKKTSPLYSILRITEFPRDRTETDLCEIFKHLMVFSVMFLVGGAAVAAGIAAITDTVLWAAFAVAYNGIEPGKWAGATVVTIAVVIAAYVLSLAFKLFDQLSKPSMPDQVTFGAVIKSKLNKFCTPVSIKD